MDFNKLFVFYQAAQKGSFSNTTLSLSPSVISRHVADLEAELDCVLFSRTSKGLALTAKGKVLFDCAKNTFPELLNTQTLLKSSSSIVNESLDLIYPTSWISNIIVPHVSEFLSKHENLNLNIINDDKPIEFLFKDYNNINTAAILPYLPKQTNLIRKFLITTKLKLYASEDYLKKFGYPKSVEDLSSHRLIASSQRDKSFSDINWHLLLGKESGEEHRPYITMNDPYFAALDGLGIASLSDHNYFVRSGKLISVLDVPEEPSISIYYIYPMHSKHSQIIREFGKFLSGIAKDYPVNYAP